MAAHPRTTYRGRPPTLVITYHAGADLAVPALRAMCEARKRVFVDLLKWDVPVIAGRYEIDEFDGADARYLIVTDRSGRHCASARLLPSTRPHILGSLYAGLCEAEVPRGPTTVEISRFCLDRGLAAAARRMARDALVVALADHALAAGIARYTGVAEIGWLQQILAFGWDCRPLGLPQQRDGRLLGALEIVITPATPQLLVDAGLTGDARPHPEMADAA